MRTWKQAASAPAVWYDADMPHEVSGSSFWNARYDAKEDGWELGAPAPPLARLLKESPPAAGRAAVPGCGRGHDVGLLARHGFDAVGFDFSDRAIAEAARLGHRVMKRDVFALAGEFAAAFDVVWEYTCFCAIDPARRIDYVQVLASILKPGGELLALFYPLKRTESGPPFGVERDEVERLLSARFRIEHAAAPADSIDRRQGYELLVRARRTR
jgi:SAM-dependent methyltransferase